MSKKIAIILINYKDYANKYLSDCLLSIRRQKFLGEKKIYIVDNASTEDSYNFLIKNAPEVEIIINKNNDGFAKGNNDAIEKAFEDGCDYIFLLNMDTVIYDDNAILESIKVAESDEKIGAVQSRLMLWPEKHLINSTGNNTHFLGFGFCKNYRDKFYSHSLKNNNIFYPSGAAVLFKKKILKEVGLFDESYFMYNEDQDLGWRIWLAGYRCVLSVDSIVYHKYEFNRSINKYYFMDRNRIITIFKNYSFITLLLIFPAFLLMELGLLIFSFKNGWFVKKIKTWLYFFKINSWKKILKERKAIQKNRKVKDSDLINMFSWKIEYQEINSPLLKIANYFFGFYFIFLKFLLKVFKI